MKNLDVYSSNKVKLIEENNLKKYEQYLKLQVGKKKYLTILTNHENILRKRCY